MSRVVIITGGSRGIGFGTAECFAKNGDTLVIPDIILENAQEAVPKLIDMGAKDALALHCDVGDRESVNKMVADTIEKFGRIDVLVNNAGICPFVHIMELDQKTWQKSIDVNLTGPFNCTQEVAKHMIENDIKGSIVFITSLADHRTNPNQVDYCATKAGLKGEMTGFAVALGKHGINCAAVAPGHVSTPMTSHYWDTDDGRKRASEIIPMGRVALATEIGNAVFFLASPEGHYVNGTTIRVDGGNAALA